MKRLSLMAASLTYMAVFLWGYATVVVPVYAGTGFTYTWPGYETITWVVTLSLIPLLVISTELSKPSTLIVWWLYITVYVPSMLMPVIILAMPESTLIVLQVCVCCAMLLLCAVPAAKTLVLPMITVSPAFFWWAVGIGWIICVTFSLLTISPSRVLANFALLFAGSSEYTLRADYLTQISESGRALGYIGRQLSQALDPFLMGYGLLSRRWRLVAAGIFGQLVYFGQTGMKEIAFAAFLIGFVYLFLRTRWKNFGILLLFGVIGIVIVSTVADLATDTATLSAQFTRRSLAGPGQLTGFYFEHFSTVQHPGHNFTGTGSFQPYGPPQEIGLYYFGSENIDANANLWAEGFAEYGIPGIVIFTCFLALMLWIYDSVAATRSLELAVLLAVVQADALTNTSPLTILITHGGIAAALLLYFAPPVESADIPSLKLLPSLRLFLRGRTYSAVRP